MSCFYSKIHPNAEIKQRLFTLTPSQVSEEGAIFHLHQHSAELLTLLAIEIVDPKAKLRIHVGKYEVASVYLHTCPFYERHQTIWRLPPDWIIPLFHLTLQGCDLVVEGRGTVQLLVRETVTSHMDRLQWSVREWKMDVIEHLADVHSHTPITAHHFHFLLVHTHWSPTTFLSLTCFRNTPDEEVLTFGPLELLHLMHPPSEKHPSHLLPALSSSISSSSSHAHQVLPTPKRGDLCHFWIPLLPLHHTVRFGDDRYDSPICIEVFLSSGKCSLYGVTKYGWQLVDHPSPILQPLPFS